MLTYLIEHARELLNPGGVLLTNLSSLSSEEMHEAIKKTGLRVRVLDRMKVPLKVCNVLNNKAWMAYLRKRGLKKTLFQGYEYYQTISIVEISLK